MRELKADGSLPADTKLRSSKYLNNLIEQDHRSVKQRIAVMLGLKRFQNAAITISGIELMHRIRKGQFGLGGWASRAELRLQSGTRCSGFEICIAQRAASLVQNICTTALGATSMINRAHTGIAQPGSGSESWNAAL